MFDHAQPKKALDISDCIHSHGRNISMQCDISADLQLASGQGHGLCVVAGLCQ